MRDRSSRPPTCPHPTDGEVVGKIVYLGRSTCRLVATTSPILQLVHRRLFGALYPWAGELRTVDISKGHSPFVRAQHLRTASDQLFAKFARDNQLRGLAPGDFAAGAARLLADLNALRPFREGNGRAQRAFLQLCGNHAGRQLRWCDLDPIENTAISEAAMSDPTAFAPLLRRLMPPAAPRLAPPRLRLASDDPPSIGS